MQNVHTRWSGIAPSQTKPKRLFLKNISNTDRDMRLQKNICFKKNKKKNERNVFKKMGYEQIYLYKFSEGRYTIDIFFNIFTYGI